MYEDEWLGSHITKKIVKGIIEEELKLMETLCSAARLSSDPEVLKIICKIDMLKYLKRSIENIKKKEQDDD